MAKQIIVRPYQSSDRFQVGILFYDTVHTINLRDYTEEQLDVWAPAISKEGQFTRPLEKSYSYIAEFDGQIVGFADITSEGCLDRLYVHKNFQRQKIASKLLETLEAKARELSLSEITTESSITAKPFLLQRDIRLKKKIKRFFETPPLSITKCSKKSLKVFLKKEFTSSGFSNRGHTASTKGDKSTLSLKYLSLDLRKPSSSDLG